MQSDSTHALESIMNSDDIMIGWQEDQPEAKQQKAPLETATTTLDTKAQGSKQIYSGGEDTPTAALTTTTQEGTAVASATTKVTLSMSDDKSTIASKITARTSTTTTSIPASSSLLHQNDNIMTSNFNNNNNNNNNDSSKNSISTGEKSSNDDGRNTHTQLQTAGDSPKSSCISKNSMNTDENTTSSNNDEVDFKSKISPPSNDNSIKGEFSNVTPASSPDDHDRTLMIANDDNVDPIIHNSDSRSPSSSSVAPSPSTTNSNLDIIQSKISISSPLTASSSADNKTRYASEDNCESISNLDRLTSTNESQIESIANASTAIEISIDTTLIGKSESKITSGDLSINSDSTIALISPHALKHQQDSDITPNVCTATSPVATSINSVLTTVGTTMADNCTSSSSNNIMNSNKELIVVNRDAESSAELRWTPGIPDCDLMMYLRAARSMAAFAGMCDGGTLSTDDFNPATRDDTTINALELLHKCNYDTSKALQALVKNPIPRSVDKKWSTEEQQRFIKAVNTRYPPKGEKKDKNFIRIRNEVLPHKKVSELVEFYYLFKKTSLFTGSKNSKKRRVAPSKLKPTKNLNNRDNNLEAGDASSDESGDNSNENDENGKKLPNHDTSCLLENASNSPSSGDQITEANDEYTLSNNNEIACEPNKIKHEPRSPSIMQKSTKSDMTSRPDVRNRVESDGRPQVESSMKLAKSIKEEELSAGDSASPDGSPRTSPPRSSLPDEKLPRPSIFTNNSYSSNKTLGEHDTNMLDNSNRGSPNQATTKPLPTGCSSLAQFTDSIGQRSPSLPRASPGPNKPMQQSITGQTSCASLAQLTERIGQSSPNSLHQRTAPPVQSNISPGLGQIPGLPGLPPNMPYGLPYWNYGQPPRPGQPPMPLPPIFSGIPGFPGFPSLNPLNPASSSPAKIPTPKSNSSGSASQRSAPNTSSPIGSMHNQSGGPILSPHQQSSSNLASPSTHINTSPNKIRTQNAILTRIIQRPDNITCARTDWTFKPQKTDAQWYLNCQKETSKRKSDKDHRESKKMAADRESHHSSTPHSHSQQQLQHQQPPMSLPSATQQPMSNFMPQHQMPPRDRDPPGPLPVPPMPGLSDHSHLLHPFPGAGSLDRPQSSRYLDNPSLGPFGFRNAPGDLTRPHTAFSPAGFPPRGTPTSLPSTTPNFLQGPGFPPIPAALEAIFMQYHHLYNERLANANANSLDFESQRRLFQHPGYPDAASAGPPGSGGGLPPPMLHNPGSPNPAALAGLIFPPASDGRDQFNERLTQPDAFRLPMRPTPDLYQAYAAAISHLGNAHDPTGGSGGQGSGPGGPGGLSLPPPPPHSQADGLGFPGGPGVRPMMPSRDQYFNPQRYASYGSPYGVLPSPFFGLGGPPAP